MGRTQNLLIHKSALTLPLFENKSYENSVLILIIVKFCKK